jgi:hypothetical protein
LKQTFVYYLANRQYQEYIFFLKFYPNKVATACARPAPAPNQHNAWRLLLLEERGWEWNAITWQVGEILTPNKRSGIYLIHQNASTINNHEHIQTSPAALVFGGKILQVVAGDYRPWSPGDNQEDRMICILDFKKKTQRRHTYIYRRIWWYTIQALSTLHRQCQCHVLPPFNHLRLCPSFSGQGDRCGWFWRINNAIMCGMCSPKVDTVRIRIVIR